MFAYDMTYQSDLNCKKKNLDKMEKVPVIFCQDIMS